MERAAARAARCRPVWRRATRCALEACFHLYGNDLSAERGPIEAGLGWCCKEATGFIGADAVRAVREAGPAEQLVAFVIDGPGIARPGNPVVGGGVVTSGTLSPSLGVGIGLAYLPAGARRVGTRSRSTCAARLRPASVRRQPVYPKPESVTRWTTPSYPEDLLYHPEHDWARIEGDGQATFGITWHAQDALGEVVFFEPPAVGTLLTQDEPYAEVESVKAVSDVIAPLSGEVIEVNDALGEDPETINDDPYGEGWMVRIRLSDPAERDALLDAAAYVAGLAEPRAPWRASVCAPLADERAGPTHSVVLRVR